MMRKKLLIVSLVAVLPVCGLADQVAITAFGVQSNEVYLGWSPSTNQFIVEKSSSLSTDQFHYVGSVLATNCASLTNDDTYGFYRLRRVAVLEMPDTNLDTVVRIAIPIKYSPTDKVYDIDVIGIAYLQAASAAITNASGVENLLNLSMLDLSGNQLTNLNVSMLTSLNSLYCDDNQLYSLLVPSNSLQVLSCDDNLQLANLDLGGCANLRSLSCNNDGLMTTLDLSSCKGIQSVDCGYNALMALNVSGCAALQILGCGNNLMSDLDVSTCTNLRVLRCEFNNITNLDLSACTNLQSISCDDNASLNVLKLGSVLCTNLSCARGELTGLDLQKCPNLLSLDYSGNQINSLDLTQCSSLQSLSCNNNGIDSLDVSSCGNLVSLSCTNNNLTTLNLQNCSGLQFIDVESNHISDLSSFGNLTDPLVIMLRGNPITDFTPLMNVQFAGCVVYISGSDPSIDSQKQTLINDWSVDVRYFPSWP